MRAVRAPPYEGVFQSAPRNSSCPASLRAKARSNRTSSRQGRVLTESVYAAEGTAPTLTLDCQREQCVGMSGIDATEVL
jgi:hypothetical protein